MLTQGKNFQKYMSEFLNLENSRLGRQDKGVLCQLCCLFYITSKCDLQGFKMRESELRLS